MNKQEPSDLYRKANEILLPILNYARYLDPYTVDGDWFLGRPFSEVEEAVSFLKAESDAGYRPAQVILAECLYRGYGVKQDHDAARKLFLEASIAEDPIAQFFSRRCMKEELLVARAITRRRLSYIANPLLPAI